MALIKESCEKETLEAWSTYTATLAKSPETLENGQYDASQISA